MLGAAMSDEETTGWKKKLQKATPKSDAWLASIIHDGIVTHEAFNERLDFNRAHVFKLADVDVHLTAPNEHIKYQSNKVRKSWLDMKARMTENPAIVECRALSGKSTDSKVAEDYAQLWNTWLQQRQEKTGESIQSGLSDGQIVDGRGILHVWRADQIHPTIPEYEFNDSIPDGEDEDWRETDDEDKEKYPDKAKKYIRSEKSIQKKTEMVRAKAGCPYQWAVLDPRDVKILPDMVSEKAVAIWIRSVKAVNYDEELRGAEVGIDMSQDSGHRIYQRPVASDTDPTSTMTRDQRSKKLTVCTVWDRSCWYEVFTENDSMLVNEDTVWEYVKGDKHGFGEPPFFIAGALTFNHPDVHRRYQAFLHGACDEKTRADFMIALDFALTEQTAIKMHLFRRQKGAPATLDDGSSVDMSPDVQSAGMLPDGLDIVTVDNDVSPGFVKAMEMELQALDDALPPAPTTDISGTTEPWTARIITQQSGILPKIGIDRQAMAIQQMIRACMRDIQTSPKEGGYGEPVSGYRQGDATEAGQVITIDPKVVPTMEVSVSINAISSQEQITMTQHGLVLLQAGVITREDFFTHYLPQKNAGKYMNQLDAETLFNTHIKPGLIAQIMGETYGSRYVMFPNGAPGGLGGQESEPDKILQARGFKGQVPGGMGLSTGPLVDNVSNPNGAIPQPALGG